MFFLGVLFLGLLSAARLPIDLLPDVAYPKLVVYTTDAGAAPEEMERRVTEPVEQAVSTVPGVQKVESVTREGVSLVTVRFGWGADMDFAALGVREKLDNLRDGLPVRASRPLVLRTDPRSEPILTLSISGGELRGLKELADAVVKRRLEQIDGVALAAVVGGPEREIQVEVDAARMEAQGLSIADVSRALAAANVSAPSGSVLRGRSRYALRTLGEFERVEEIAEVVVRRAAGGAAEVRLKDVATLTDGEKERESVARYTGPGEDGTMQGGEAVGLLVFKSAGANTVSVAKRVDAVVAELKSEFPQARLVVASSQAGFIADALDNVTQEVVFGGLLAFLVLFLFLRNWRYPVAVALVIPISLVATFALMHAAGITLNLLSLGGMALGVGLLMDNSIVVLENIFRHREKGLGAAAAAALGAEEVQRAITASTLTTVAVFGPIVYVQGVAAELLKSLALAVAFSLLASILVAITLLPLLAARWGGEGSDEVKGWMGEGVKGCDPHHSFTPSPRHPSTLSALLDGFERGFARFQSWYERLLDAGLKYRGRVMALAAGLLVGGLLLGLSLERSVLPVVDQGEFRARLTLPRGTPLERTAEVAVRLEEVLRADSEVAAIFTRVGRQAALAGVDDSENGPHTALLEVRLKEGAATARVLGRLRQRLEAVAPGALAIETSQATALGKLLGGGEADLAVRIRAERPEAALAYARQAEAALRPLGVLGNVRVGTQLGQPEVRVRVDRERAASYGIDPAVVTHAVEAAMSGAVATEFVAFDRKVPVVVRLPESERRSSATLEMLRVGGVPLRELVQVETTTGPAEIRRVDQSRVVSVYADVLKGGVDDAVDAVRAALSRAPAPAGVRVEVGGENEEMREGFRQIALAFLLALVLVYMLLAAEFESLLHPFIILLAVPLSAVGATFALWVTGAGINTMSLIGMVILVGIVDNDAVVKVDFINQMRREGMSVREAIRAAGHARLRPIVINTITSVLGVLPMALGIGPGAELQAPLAIAVLGGLISATALTLVVIPVSYELLEELRVKLSRRRAGSMAEEEVAGVAPALGD
jgi:HAE1 family hydrophobic/amphiphilic exporter-1